MKKAIMPYILRGISSDQVRDIKRIRNSFNRTLAGKNPTLEIFLKADDPYSYLLVQALQNIHSRFKVSLKFHVFHDIDPEMYPRLEMWREYAKHDAFYLASLYGYLFPEKKALPNQTAQSAAQLAIALASIENDESFLTKATSLFEAFWFGGEGISPTVPNPEKSLEILKRNEALLKRKGHYLGAMINFEGEWYWGVDRLDHLEARLIKQGLSKSPNETVLFNRTYKDFCQNTLNKECHLAQASNKEPLILYWSARSPYSYIGLERATMLARHYNLPLVIKPVLPMMMRGMNVPHTKKLYIFLDTKREASKLGLPYGFVADPLGAAVERCYALVEYARSENKLQEFLLSFARGVNAEGIRAETDRGMEKIVSRCGLDWGKAKPKMCDFSWRDLVKTNLDEMLELGCWGVPTIRYGDQHFWGQDRFGLLEKYIQVAY